jgi:hypothetical protein
VDDGIRADPGEAVAVDVAEVVEDLVAELEQEEEQAGDEDRRGVDVGARRRRRDERVREDGDEEARRRRRVLPEVELLSRAA